jgi:hypothetical protein
LGQGSEFEQMRHNLKHVRNTLAHGGSLLDAESVPAKSIALFAQVRRFAEATWRVAGLDRR